MRQTKEERRAQRAAYFQANKDIIRQKLRKKAALLQSVGYVLPLGGEKSCAQCGEVQAISGFTRCAVAPDGLSYRCKKCDKAYADPAKAKARSDAWYAENRDRRLAVGKAWREANAATLKISRRIYRQNNREQINATIARWNVANADRKRATTKAWAEKHPERRRSISKAFRERHPEAAAAGRAARRAVMAAAEGAYTADDVKRIAKDQRGRCAYCREKLHGKWHVDHIVALSRGGSNWPSNIQLTCIRCNLTKHAKDPIDFARQIGRLL